MRSIVCFARVPLGLRGDFGGKQTENDPVLVGRPDRSVSPEERRSGALLAGEAERAADQAIDEPFEPHGHFDKLAAELRGDAVDDAAADNGLADGAAAAPAGTILEQIRNGNREVMIGIHQAVRPGHDAVPVGIGVVGEGNVEFVAHADQPRHGIGRRAIHPDLCRPNRPS